MADLSKINDEEELHKMMQKTEDFDERKRIRARMKELRETAAKEYEAKKGATATEDAVQMRLRQAEADKQRKMKEFEKQQKEHEKAAQQPDAVEQLAKMRLAEAEADKQKKLEEAKEMSGAMSAAYGVRSQDIAKTASKATEEKGAKIATAKGVGGKQFGASKAAAGKKNARSAMNQFKQMDAASGGAAKGRGGGVQRSPSGIKESLLNWTKAMTREYGDAVNIENFSTSWNNGMAFCALIHHFYPDAFDFSSLDPKKRRDNFTLAFNTAEQKADIAPLLDVEDMVRMKTPDWKCVFTYIQAMYKGLHTHERNKAAPRPQ